MSEMLKIAHRVNSLEMLEQTPQEYGVEMDLHAYEERLVVHHDPFQEGIEFSDWLNAFKHRFVILNIKEEGIESRVRQLVLDKGIRDYFFLDLSFPALMKLVRQNESQVAYRVSEYESVQGVLKLAGRVDWVWLDQFHSFPLSKKEYNSLRLNKFKLCLVSPELHGRDIDEIAEIRSFMKSKGFEVDAVCTKRPDLW